MDNLKGIIKQIIPNVEGNKVSWIQYFKQHPSIKPIFEQSPLKDEAIVAGFNDLFRFLEEENHCNQCISVKDCPNLLQGHFTKIDIQLGQIQSKLVKCNKLIFEEKEQLRSRLFKNQYIARDILQASFKDIEPTKGRQDALAAIMEFCKLYSPGENRKGIYLYGSLGVGKSYMMVAAAKKLAEKGISSLMVYVPDFFREMKNSIQDNSLNEKMEHLKNVDVLILDDIGAETISQWERDEILGAILQARMVNGLPTMYTSNLSYDDLEEHLAYSYKGGEEKLKAMRIMERIRHYTVPFFVEDKNYRM